MVINTEDKIPKILKEFQSSSIRITNNTVLKEYIAFCIENNQDNKIKSCTSYHHILPNALFPEYKNLKENTWNGTHLLHKDHYYAHWLLTEAIDDYGQLFAFCAMHNKDIILERIKEKDLISPEKFQEKMEQRSKEHSDLWKDKEYNKKVSAKIAKTRNTKEWKETIGKEALIKCCRTKNSKEWKETKGKESIKKQTETKNELITYENKIIRKIDMIQITNLIKIKKKADIFYDVYSGDKLILSGLHKIEIQRIHRRLINSSKEKPLGLDTRSFAYLKKENKEYLSSLYRKETKIGNFTKLLHMHNLGDINEVLEKLPIRTIVFDVYKEGVLLFDSLSMSDLLSIKGHKKYTELNYMGIKDRKCNKYKRGLYFKERIGEPKNNFSKKEFIKKIKKTKIIPYKDRFNYKIKIIKIYKEGIFIEKMIQKDACKKYSSGIITANESNYLGYSKQSYAALKRLKKLHLVGFYSK